MIDKVNVQNSIYEIQDTYARELLKNKASIDDVSKYIEENKEELKGKDGTSVTHSWNGTTLIVTSASGTTSADLKGATGPQGIQGERGEAFSIAKTYNSISEMENDFNNENIAEGQFVLIDTGNIEDEDNAKLYIKGKEKFNYITDLSGATGVQGPQGVQGIQGVQGNPGYSPQRGIDYWTETDIEYIKSYVDEAILGGAW